MEFETLVPLVIIGVIAAPFLSAFVQIVAIVISILFGKR